MERETETERQRQRQRTVGRGDKLYVACNDILVLIFWFL